MPTKSIFAASAIAAALAVASIAHGQASQPPAADQAAPQYSQAQLDQLLAPIALYPDELLGDVLMAAGYPREVVAADRWAQDPYGATFPCESVAESLDGQQWDPSVKSLVVFPNVLRMMNGQIDWTEALGEAFIADPSAVMDSVQRLRTRAEAAGALRSNAQVHVADLAGLIIIDLADPQRAYVPDYGPTVYGRWPYADWAPYSFPGYFDHVAVAGYGACLGGPFQFRGWSRVNWGLHRIEIDRGRFRTPGHDHHPDHGHPGDGHPPPTGAVPWKHDTAHRDGVAYLRAENRARFQGGAASPDATRAARGSSTGAARQDGSPGVRLTSITAPVSTVRPAFESYRQGSDGGSRAQGWASGGAASYQHGAGGGGAGFTGGGHGGGYAGGGGGFSGGGHTGGGGGGYSGGGGGGHGGGGGGAPAPAPAAATAAATPAPAATPR